MFMVNACRQMYQHIYIYIILYTDPTWLCKAFIWSYGLFMCILKYLNSIRISGSLFIEIDCQSSPMTTFWAWIFSSTNLLQDFAAKGDGNGTFNINKFQKRWTCFCSHIHGCFNWSILRWWPLLRAILNRMFRDDRNYLPMRKVNKSFQVWGIGSHQSNGYNLHLRGFGFFREHSGCLW